MEKINILKITLQKIKDRELEGIIPELYELKQVIENNQSHINDPVFNHTISVLIELEGLFGRVNGRVGDYLAPKIDSYSKKQLLFLATVFHDVGKKETLQREGDTVRFPGHEEASARKFSEISSRFDLSEKERNSVIQITRNHGFFHNLLDQPDNNLEEKIKEFQMEHRNVFLEIVLLTVADILGSQLKQNNQQKFDFKIGLLNKIIESAAE